MSLTLLQQAVADGARQLSLNSYSAAQEWMPTAISDISSMLGNLVREMYPRLLLHSLVTVQPFRGPVDLVSVLHYEPLQASGPGDDRTSPWGVKQVPIVARPRRLRSDLNTGAMELALEVDRTVIDPLLTRVREAPPVRVTDVAEFVRTMLEHPAIALPGPTPIQRWILAGKDAFALFQGAEDFALDPICYKSAVHADCWSMLGPSEWVLGHRLLTTLSGCVWCPFWLTPQYITNGCLGDKLVGGYWTKFIMSCGSKFFGTAGFAHGTIG